MRERLTASLMKEKIIVIVRGVAAERLLPLADAMYAGGIRFLEITYTAGGSDMQTARQIEKLVAHCGGKMAIGAGTVLTARQAELTASAGGQFVISPDINPAVIRKTKALGLMSVPGALTPSEIARAHRSGADFVKLFPVTSLGTDYVKAVSAPLSNVRLLAVGGVNEQNIPDWLQAGVCGFGIGSSILPKAAVAARDFDAVTKLAKRYVTAVKTWQPI